MLGAVLARARQGALLLPVWWTNDEGVCQCPKKTACPSPGKHPLTERGLDDATSNPEIIEEWLQRWPSANVAVRTDRAPRIDMDLPDVASEIIKDVALPLTTELVGTPRGGLHIATATTAPIRSRTLHLQDGRKLGELKADRAYVLVPPSAIGGKRYIPLSPDGIAPMEVDDPVAWLARLLPAFGFALASEQPDGHRDYQALAGVVHEGEGRHNALTSYAGRIWIEGMAPEALAGALTAVNQAQCNPPLPDDELQAIADHFIERREQTNAPACVAAVPVTRRVTGTSTRTAAGREEVLEALSKWLYLPDLEAVDVLMATAIAIHLPGDPLWLYYVGPPGGTKTEPLRALKGPRVVSLSSLTPQTLISGYKGDPEKVDLLPKLDGKLLVIKDYTSILSKKAEDAAAIFADLREAYDGYLEKSFGSGVGTKVYSSRCGLIAAVTPAIDRFRTVHSLLGERFLRIDLHTDPEATIRRASELEGQEASMRGELQRVVGRCLEQASEWVSPDVLVEQRFLDQLRALAHVAATLRTEVERDRQRLVMYEPVPEVGTRLVKQLQKLAKALANWRERLVVAPEDYVTIRRVALDCVRSQRRKVAGALQASEVSEMATADVGSAVAMPSDTTREVCEDLWQVGVLERHGGQHSGWRWSLDGGFRLVMERAAVDLRSAHEE